VKDWRKIGAFAICVTVVTVLDHTVKLLALAFLSDGQRYAYLRDVVRIEGTYNTGAILGLGSQLPDGIRAWVMPFVTVLILIWVSVLLIRERGFGLAAAGLSLVWAGGFSNLVDRLAYGQVYDFANLGIGPVFRTGIFNVADMVIVAGIPLILIGWLRTKSPQPQIGPQ
jgi:signal peptidase II